MITIVAAVSRDGFIADAHGRIPWRLPNDMTRFRQLTLGRTVVMGRKTLASIGKTLVNRTNLVLTRGHEEALDPFDPHAEAHVVDSIQAAIDCGDEDLFVIGGGEVYAAFLPLADRLEITHVEKSVGAGVRFPLSIVDLAKGWECVSAKGRFADERHTHDYVFETWRKRAKQGGSDGE